MTKQISRKPLQILVVWMTRQHAEHYLACDTLEDAEQTYRFLLRSPDTYTASICAPIASTDYEDVTLDQFKEIDQWRNTTTL